MAVQLPLRTPAPFFPIHRGPGHYVPVLQNKAGELRALRMADEVTWSRMTPVIRLVGPRNRTKPLKRARVRNWINRVSESVGGRCVYLDTIRVAPTHPVETGRSRTPLLKLVYEYSRKRELSYVPILHVGQRHTARQGRIVAESVLRDGRGVCVHYPADIALPAGTTHRDTLIEALDMVMSDIASADLWIDLAYLDPIQEILPRDIAYLVNELASVGDWRSLMLTGTSTPQTLGGFIGLGSVDSISRREWTLWNEVIRCGLDRIPAFGDYAIQHPFPPHEGGGPGMRANIRYTVGDRLIVARGFDPVSKVGNVEYPSLCQELIATHEVQDSSYTWGDSVIHSCAQGRVHPGSQEQWRGAGTSHHLRYVTDQLSGLDHR